MIIAGHVLCALISSHCMSKGRGVPHRYMVLKVHMRSKAIESKHKALDSRSRGHLVQRDDCDATPELAFAQECFCSLLSIHDHLQRHPSQPHILWAQSCLKAKSKPSIFASVMVNAQWWPTAKGIRPLAPSGCDCQGHPCLGSFT